MSFEGLRECELLEADQSDAAPSLSPSSISVNLRLVDLQQRAGTNQLGCTWEMKDKVGAAYAQLPSVSLLQEAQLFLELLYAHDMPPGLDAGVDGIIDKLLVF